MITINKLNIQYGDKHLFRDISAQITPRDRIGLVGVNGAGKSTLLQIIAGTTETDFGVVTKAKKATIGYLPQEIGSFPPGRTLYKEAETAFDHVINMQKELENINRKLAATAPDSPQFSALLEQQGELQHQLDQSDVFRIQSKIEKVLAGLGFRENDFDRDCQSFSGGWIMRLMLAKHLLAQPDFLLLDEPTNHLDIETLTWLEEFLKSYPGSLVIISHDRAFLDTITATTWELSLGALSIYKGNYSKYVEEKEVRLQVTRAAYDNQQTQIQQTMRFVQRFRAKSTKAKQVQSRLKQLGKMEKIEIEETNKTVSFRFPPAAPSGRLAITVKQLSKSYEDSRVFTDISFDLQRGDKLAIVGVNGAGKSTLVKLLAGLIRPDSGAIQPGHNVKLSYFGQHQAQELSGSLTVLETMSFIGEDKTLTQVRSLLGAFLFSGNDVDKKVQVLSGGEKSRLALARMIASPANLLIMDEPTNHLDMTSQEILQEAMAQYDGSIIVVSHNRYFSDQFVNKVLEIKDGRATLYEGNISDYLERITKSRIELQKKQPPLSVSGPVSSSKKNRETKKAEAVRRQQKSQRLAPSKKKVEQAEKEIEKLEKQKSSLEQELAAPELYKDQDTFAEKSREYKDTERRLERTYLKWELAQGEIEKIEAQFKV